MDAMGLENSLKKCPHCGWSGYIANKMTCMDCHKSFYICPDCGKQAVIYEEVPYLFPSCTKGIDAEK